MTDAATEARALAARLRKRSQCVQFNQLGYYGPGDAVDACAAADFIEALTADRNRTRGEVDAVIQWLASERTCEEMLAGNESKGWLAAGPFERVKMMGQRKRERDAMILRARAALAQPGPVDDGWRDIAGGASNAG